MVAGVLSVVVPAVAFAVAPAVTFKSTGAEQRYHVPAGARLLAVLAQGAWGGGWGGGCCPAHYTSVIGQSGAGWLAFVPVKPGETLYVEVGSNGTANGRATFGGGGAAGSPNPEGAEAASGGGATDIRTCSEHAVRCPGGGTSLASRLLVAGGAGGNGGAEVTDAAGLLCGAGTEGGQALNGQPLPKGNAAIGPPPIKTKSGTVIPGFVGAGAPTASVGTQNGDTDAGAGSTVAGSGGSGTTCHGGGAYQGDTFSDSVSGSPGHGPDGGTGGNAAGLKPLPCNTAGNCNDAGPGGGGGGGYFGGGGGVSGFDACTSPSPGPCNAVTASMGGGAGSSFIAKSVLYPTPNFGLLGSGVPFVEVAPVVRIASPVNGAVYHPRQVVRASWACSMLPGVAGVQNCTGTAASGSAISTTPGKHTFTVHGVVTANEPVTVRVTYTVR